jgi:hypothetical protein
LPKGTDAEERVVAAAALHAVAQLPLCGQRSLVARLVGREDVGEPAQVHLLTRVVGELVGVDAVVHDAVARDARERRAIDR